MDLQKERKAFEKYIQTVAHPHRSPKAMFFTVNDGYGNIIYADPVIQDQWSTWQAAIKHVVPDGFVLVTQKDLLDLTVAINAVDLATHTESKANEVREMWQQIAIKLVTIGVVDD